MDVCFVCARGVDILEGSYCLGLGELFLLVGVTVVWGDVGRLSANCVLVGWWGLGVLCC